MISTSARGWLLLITFFAAGLVAGYAIGRPHGLRPSRVDNPMEPHVFVERLTSDLHLDAPQRDSITGILTRRQRVIDSAWRALEPGVRATIRLGAAGNHRCLTAGSASEVHGPLPRSARKHGRAVKEHFVHGTQRHDKTRARL